MRVPNDKNGLQDEAYRLYQLDWMAAHGESPESLFQSVMSHHVDCIDPDDPDTASIPDLDAARSLYNGWKQDTGFLGGSLWACKDEFLETEYQDAQYMRRLLPEDVFKVYCRFHPSAMPAK